MSEQRNIVILGGSSAGMNSAHYILKHIIPSLQAKNDGTYHVYLVSSSSDFFFRMASPRAIADPSRMPQDKIFRPIVDGFKKYPKNLFTFVHATAAGLDTSSRTVTLDPHTSDAPQSLTYHALVVATGSRTPSAAHSLHGSSEESKDAINVLSKQISGAKNIIIAGGGPTGVETAGEIGEFLNGKPGWFSTPTPVAKVTLITSEPHLLPALLPKRGALAEKKLKKLGVDVVYNRRVINAAPSASGSNTTVTLDKGDTLETDLYLPTMGVIPNTSFIPSSLLNEKNKLKTNGQTLRVDEAGPRVYALGDVSSYSKNCVQDIQEALPVMVTNMKRDLEAWSSYNPDAKPSGADRLYEPNHKEMMVVPIGSAGGVGAIFGWKAPNWLIWFFKGRDYMVKMAVEPLLMGTKLEKEFKWKL